jgi:hypothetical protein
MQDSNFSFSLMPLVNTTRNDKLTDGNKKNEVHDPGSSFSWSTEEVRRASVRLAVVKTFRKTKQKSINYIRSHLGNSNS